MATNVLKKRQRFNAI